MSREDQKSFFEILKESPLCRSLEVAPEESAIWLDMRSLSSADGIKKVLKAVEENAGKFPEDWIGPEAAGSFKRFLVHGPVSRPSVLVLKHVFEAMFKAGVLDSKHEELEKLLAYAVKRRNAWKAKMKKLRRHDAHALEMFEVFAELVMRLDAKIREVLDESGDS